MMLVMWRVLVLGKTAIKKVKFDKLLLIAGLADKLGY
jgi:hypothetical protein